MPSSALVVATPFASRSIDRHPIATADTAMMNTCASATSASALPCPKRWSLSAGCAAMRTPNKVTRLASRSSVLSAKLPSIATDPVSVAPHALRPISRIALVTLASAARVARPDRSPWPRCPWP